MKKLFAILLSLAMMFALAACYSTDGDTASAANEPAGDTTEDTAQDDATEADAGTSGSEGGKIGVLLPSLSFDFQAQMAAGVKRAADEAGFEYQEIDYDFDAELEVAGIETMAAAGVDAYYGIFMSAETDSALLQNYPDIGTISQAMDVEANAFILNDYDEMGQQYVDALDHFRTENGLEGGEMAGIWLTACEVEGSDFNAAMGTVKGYMTDYAEQESLDYVGDWFAETDEDASNIAEQLLNAYPDLRYVFCFNNGYALVVANEITSGVQDTSSYFVFSSEGDEESFRLISSGDSPYRACAFQDIEGTGYMAGLQLINWVENREIEDVVAERFLVDSRNVDDYT